MIVIAPFDPADVALVSGGSRGIGRAISLALAREGVRVVLTSRTLETAERAAQEIASESGVPVRGLALDISDDGSVESAVKTVLGDYGRISILVNSAGVTRDGLLLRMKKEDWQVVVETNLSGVFYACRAVVPSMIRARHGRIVNVTSVVAHTGNPGQVNYTASKAGIEGFSRSLAREIASRNITVNCVAPGFIDTDMTRDLDESTRRKLMDQVPMSRLGRPDDVAAAVVFLASRRASYLTGVTLHVNGGMHM